MRVLANDFVKEYKSIKQDIDGALKRVLQSGWFILGSEVANFESEFAKFIGTKYCLGVASGTDALTIALRALDLKANDEVLLPANVYPTVFGVHHAGVKIKLVDVDPETLNISTTAIKKAITKSTKAIIAVHLYGNPANLDEVKKIVKENSLYLIEDCAQATGALWENKKVGSRGDISCFSFYPTKNLGAYGDAGAILTNNKKIYDNTKLWRMYGEQGRYDSVLPGLNSRLDEVQAAILRVKLSHVAQWNRTRSKLAEIYKKQLSGLPIKFLETQKQAYCSYHLLVVMIQKRDQLLDFLKKQNISVGVHYPTPIHLTKSFKYLGKKGSFPVSEKSCNEIISLPISPTVTVEEVEFVCGKIREFFK